ncbi:Dimodular nonribosomal peptide synthase [Streptomyces sp. YIM 130001]|uniref:non-ribosomal peptide synthetase n=1 Tax=Streptomyces sp. YIM 130001 TaxID=2259644 RepID=UPI000ED76027|nr:non-ribosomal peptide synthetase [Streptomyces sp. YIM 130001]RII11183.1 Dimodular nonribosomal peptide synthase [Streptomyces sp. YIM 130001]
MGHLPLTAAQRGLWFAQRIDVQNPSYNIAEYADIDGPVDADVLRAAVEQAAEETEALRVTFTDDEGVPFQRIRPRADIDVPLVDLSDTEDPHGEAIRRMESALHEPADIVGGPLVRMTLYRLTPARHLFHQQIHHVALDGYGAALALARIAEAYTALLSGVDSRPGPGGTLAAVVEQETDYLESQQRRLDKEFWEGYLADTPTPTGLGDARRRPGHTALRASRDFDGTQAERLRAAARDAGVGWPTFFMTAMGIYLHRSRGLSEVVLGLPVTGRRTALARTTPAMLSNVLPMRLRMSPADRVADVAKRASAQAREVLRHQRYPSEDLRRDLGLIGTDVPLTGPSVNVLAFDDTLGFGTHHATLHNLSIGPVEDMAIAVHASYADGGMRVDLLGNPGLHTSQELAGHHERLCRLLDAFAEDPDRTVGSLQLLGSHERREVLSLAEHSAADAVRHTGGAPLPEQLAEQARISPHETAVVCGSARLTFAQLDTRVDVLAGVLAATGAGPGTRVAVGLPRSTDLVVAMLAAMRTGAAYLPLDPSYPADRLAYMIEDSRPVVLVATAHTADVMDPRRELPLVDPALVEQEPDVGVPCRPGARDVAYVIYTSGSTGRPKGVAVEHRSLSNLLEHHRRETYASAERNLGRRLRVALTAVTSFDASWDPVLWMVAGHELHIVEDGVRRDPEALVDFLVTQRIDAIETTPVHLRHLLSAGLLNTPVHRPRVIALGGEAVDEGLWNELAAEADLLVFNFYGPTETTVDSVTARITGEQPVIGRPVAGARVYVLDPSLHPLPQGAAGELYVSGEGVARGYAGRPGPTSERFLPDPFGPPGGRMYRTGDLARWSEGGSLEFLGRSDRQVKVRGHRVETGEIESTLRSLAGVTDAAVTLTASQDSAERLAAYLVRDETHHAGRPDVDLTEVRDALAGTLPEHMVPSAYAVVPALPLTPNGKLDTDRLPCASPVSSRGGDPRTPQEARMCEVFAACLDLPRVGRDDSFFLLGGHSLMATRLVSRIRGAFGVELPIRALFEAPTPASLVGQLATASIARPPMRAVRPRPDRLPLSFGQQRLWILREMGEDSDSYHLPVALRLSGPLDQDALAAALADLTHRHESLRTVFAVDDAGVHQLILRPESAHPPLMVMPFTGAGTPDPDRAPFDLSRDLPLRAQLFPTAHNEHTLVLTLHHIAVDGWSLGPLMRDLSTAYAARAAGSAPDWRPLDVQYADYALWQRTLLGEPREEDSIAGRQLAYWSSALDGLPKELTFPLDRPRPAQGSGRGGKVPVMVDAATHSAVVRMAADCGVSSFMVLHAALAALMTRLGAGEDIAIGTPVAGRTDESLADVVGFFVNTLVLRADTSASPSFHELVERVRRVDLAAYAHQDLPFERIVEEAAPERALSRHPLFQVMLSLNNTPPPRLDLDGLAVHHEPAIGGSGAKFDLTWDLTERHDGEGGAAGIAGELEFSQDLFDRDTAVRFAQHFSRLLVALLAAPDRPAADAEFLTSGQYAAALGGPPPASPVPTTGSACARTAPAVGQGQSVGDDSTIVDMLSMRAAVQPNRTAVVAADGRLTFSSLMERSEQLARKIQDFGIGAGDRVAVALPRDTSHIVALLGVLRSGAAYVPLDASHPQSRNQMILDSAAPRLLLTTPVVASTVPSTTERLLLDDPRTWQPSDDNPSPGPRPHDVAYVLHTSGSTGVPKGVAVEHSALLNLFTGHRERLMAPAEADNNGRPLRIALTAAMTFDASWDPLLWMIAGHELHLVDDATRRDAEALTALIHDNCIDVVETTPSFLDQLRTCGLFAPGRPRMRVLALGGEPLNEALWQELGALHDVAVWNLYGPTETTVDSVMGRVTAGTRPHLGTAVAGMRARVLDARLRPAAPGATGELYLSGAGLARGYENQHGGTATRFLPDPYGPSGTRMYRTGDLVRRRQGLLEYVGRADGQAKVRGFRVETGEIESALADHPDVAQSAVTVRPDPHGDGRLVGWVVACDGRTISPRTLRAFVAERLPGYMVPSTVIAVPALPLTSHGKVDLNALPVEDLASQQLQPAHSGARDDSEPPHSAREEILCALFAESLEQQRVGRNDDFFELGGHSLLATRVISRIRSAFGVELPVRALFESTTPAKLAERLDLAGTARPALRRTRRPARPALSPAQQRLWFLHELDPDASAYHICVAVQLRGTVDRHALHRALADVVARHESLRTRINSDEQGPYQSVLTPGDARPDLTVTPLPEESVSQALRDAAGRPFDLANEIPLRADLFQLAEDRHTLLITVHHIAADGWSMGPLAQDLAGAYTARTAGRAPNWTHLPVQYTDYTLWQRELLGSSDDPGSLVTEQLAYWKAEMAGAPEETPLPVDRPRPAVSTGRGGTVTFQLPPGTTAALSRLARESTTSTFMVLHTALTALLHRMGAGDDITVGTPVAGRTDDALDAVVGFFVNTLALRADVSADPTFSELLARVRDTDLAAYAHQELPFERLVEELGPSRSLSRHPLFQVMLTLNNTQPPRLDLPGLQAEMEGVDTAAAKFDLSFSFTQRPGHAPGDDTLEGTLEFSRDLFDAATASRITDWFLRLTAQAFEAPDTRLSDLDLVDTVERTRLLTLGHSGTATTDAATVLDRFAETVAHSRSGDIALTAPDDQVSFAELDARSDRIAALLRASGAAPGDSVAVLLPRSVDSVAALLGVFKASAVCAPLDAGLPQGRIEAVLDDARPALVVATDATAHLIPDTWPRLVLDHPDTADLLREPAATTVPLTPPGPGAAAYLIHTSGSTGRPKGVRVGHASLARLLEHHRRHTFAGAVRATGRRRMKAALSAALSFDASLDPLLWMIDGHHLYLLDDATRRDSEALVEAVRKQHLDVLESTPTHVRQLLDAGLLAPGEPHHPAVVILGGEAVPSSLWTTLRESPAVQSWNFYGPTEATVDTLIASVHDTVRPVLGAPVTSTRVALLDTRLRPVPVGVTGDLYLAGDSLAHGYHGRPAETAASFVPDPYGPAGTRMYRTGDRAVRASDGSLVFAGRDDSQIKIRGFRVEPDEVAAVLEAHRDVRRAAVLPRQHGPSGTRLAAYVTFHENPDRTATAAAQLTAVRGHATRHLPAYMVPSGWVSLDRLPLTPNGKLDRDSLPDAAPLTRSDSAGRSPRNPREDMLCTLFAEVLSVEQVLIDDDFFDLGGHSLLATRLIARIRATLGVDITIRSLFEAPTVALLVERLLDTATDNPLATLLPLRTTGGRPPLFCVHPAGGLAWSYGGLLPHLDPDQPLYGLQTPNLDGGAPFPDSIEAMAAVYVSELRTVQPNGPYHLFGWSFGGNVVQEVAVQLQEAGEHVALLTILDAFPLAPLDDLDSADRDTVFRALLSNMGVGADALDGKGPLQASGVREEFRRVGSPLGSLQPATIDAMVDNFAGQSRLMRNYTPRTFHGPALFFTAVEGRTTDVFGIDLWAPYIEGHIENHDVPCAHAQMMQPAAREQIGTTLAGALRAGHPTAQGEQS